MQNSAFGTDPHGISHWQVRYMLRGLTNVSCDPFVSHSYTCWHKFLTVLMNLAYKRYIRPLYVFCFLVWHVRWILWAFLVAITAEVIATVIGMTVNNCSWMFIYRLHSVFYLLIMGNFSLIGSVTLWPACKQYQFVNQNACNISLKYRVVVNFEWLLSKYRNLIPGIWFSLGCSEHVIFENEQKGFDGNLRVCLRQWNIYIYWAASPWVLTRYTKLRIARAPGMPGTFSQPPTSKETAS